MGSVGPWTVHITFVFPCSTYDEPSDEFGWVLTRHSNRRSSFHLLPSILRPSGEYNSIRDIIVGRIGGGWGGVPVDIEDFIC